jgi:hypothetical protein
MDAPQWCCAMVVWALSLHVTDTSSMEMGLQTPGGVIPS